jgi:hypothetical protein
MRIDHPYLFKYEVEEEEKVAQKEEVPTQLPYNMM